MPTQDELNTAYQTGVDGNTEWNAEQDQKIEAATAQVTAARQIATAAQTTADQVRQETAPLKRAADLANQKADAAAAAANEVQAIAQRNAAAIEVLKKTSQPTEVQDRMPKSLQRLRQRK